MPSCSRGCRIGPPTAPRPSPCAWPTRARKCAIGPNTIISCCPPRARRTTRGSWRWSWRNGSMLPGLFFQRADIALRQPLRAGLEQAAHDLAGARFWQLVDEAHLLGPRDRPEMMGHMLAQLLAQIFARLIARVELDIT